jgi:aconitase A
MENKKIILSVIVVVCIAIAGVVAFTLNTNPIKNSSSTHDLGNNSSVDNNKSSAKLNNSSNTNNSSGESINSISESSNSETEGVSKEQAKERAYEEVKGKGDFITLGDPVWRSQDKMWNVPLFNKDKNNQHYGNVYIYCDNGKITKVVPYF